jgi:acetoin utilization deacetylase AcuC-like enzyme
MTLLYTAPLFLEHETGAHPERPDRLRSITTSLANSGLDKKCVKGEFQPIDPKSVSALHAAKQIHQVRELSARGGGQIDADTIVSARSYDVGLAAAGACVAAVDALLKGPERSALCLVRPPGHHATPTQALGFCLFNSVALAAHHAKTVHQLTRILIVDWDVHHGNGTQDIFYEDANVLFFSIHRYGHGFYPGTGAASETGRGKGLGRIVNVPIRYGTSRKDYLDKFSTALEAAASKCKPELVFISAGFDAHADDPIGSLGLDVDDFRVMTRAVRSIAQTHAQGRVVSCLEGGYDLQALAASVSAHLEELLTAGAAK